MDKEHTLGLMKTCMKGNTRMVKLMVKEHKLFLMGENGQVSSEKINVGTTIYNKNGNIIGKFVNGIEYDKYGNFQGKWVNGVQQ